MFIAMLPALAGAPHRKVVENSRTQCDTFVFRFVPERVAFYRYRIYRYNVYNHPEIERFEANIERYRSQLEDGTVKIKVEGRCSDGKTVASIRSNHVKSEMILHSGLKESHFYTVNHDHVESAPTDVVVVTIPAWTADLPVDKKNASAKAAASSPIPPVTPDKKGSGVSAAVPATPNKKSDAAPPAAVPATQDKKSDAAPPAAVPAAQDKKSNAAPSAAVPVAQDTKSDAAPPAAVPVAQDTKSDAAPPAAVPATQDKKSDAGQSSDVSVVPEKSNMGKMTDAGVAKRGKPVLSMTGELIDENNKPMEGVNIYMKNPMTGTSSNAEGRFTFNFPEGFTDQYLYFSSIGYHTDSIWLTNNPDSMRWRGENDPLRIRMRPDIQMMSEITVTPDALTDSVSKPVLNVRSRPRISTKTILNRAYSRIPENYPNTPVHYDVFYREANKTPDGKYVAVAEAMLDVYKNSYDKPKDKGQVKIAKSRKSIIPLYDSIVYMHFYGGAFAFIAKDHVLVRSKVIDPASYDQFRYTQEEMTRFDGRDIYVIGFTDKKNGIYGKLYIEADKYAYVRMEINTSRTIPDDGLDRSNISEAVQYIPYKDGKWHLNQIKYTDRKKIYSTGMEFDSSVEHVAVQINTKNSVQPIPKNQRLSYRDPFYMMAKNYNPNYWKGDNVLQQDSALQQTLESLHSTEDIDKVMASGYDKTEVAGLIAQIKENREKNLIVTKHDAKTNQMKKQFDWKQFHRKIYGGLGVHYQGVTTQSGTYSFAYPASGNGISFNKERKAQSLQYGLDLLLGVNLTDKWSVFWTGTGNPLVSDIKIPNNKIGAEYRINLKERGDPLYIAFSAAFGWGEYYADFGTMDNTAGTFNANGTEIDAARVNIRGGVRQTVLSPGISLMGKINRIFEIELYARYNQPVREQLVTRIKEKEGFFLVRKKAFISDYIRATSSDGNSVSRYVSVTPFQMGIILKLR
jgi:hypothetical protein